MEVIEKSLRVYIDQNKRIPYSEWLRSLRDDRARQKIQVRLARVRLGNLGQCDRVGEGVSELKINFGPGYRVYIGQEGTEIVVLLCGGDKSSQDADIKKAKGYWADYKKEKRYANY